MRQTSHSWLIGMTVVALLAGTTGCSSGSERKRLARALQDSELRLTPIPAEDVEGASVTEVASDTIRVVIIEAGTDAVFRKAFASAVQTVEGVSLVRKSGGGAVPELDYALFHASPILVKVFPGSAGPRVEPVLRGALGRLEAFTSAL